jgi:protein-glutamine gamma-glutamyltransferase
MLVASFLAVATAQVLDLPSLVLFGSALGLRILSCWKRLRVPQISETAETVAGFLYLGFFPIDYYLISRDFLTSTVHLVFFLTAMLLLRARSTRDYGLLEIVAFMQILAAAALSQSSVFVVLLAIFFLFGLAAATSREILSQTAGSQQSTLAAGLSPRLAVLSIVQFLAMVLLGAGFFFFLPRTARAAVDLWMPSRFHVSGFSNSVTLGQIGEIRRNTTPVMHARLYNPVEPYELKWRGATLALFDGKRWYNPATRPPAPVKIENHLVPLSLLSRPGRRVFYDVQTRPSASDVLFFLGSPELLQIDTPQIERMPGNGFRATGMGEQLRYSARGLLPTPGAPPDPSLPPLAPGDLQTYLQVPRLDARVVKLAEDIAPGAGPAAKAQALEQYLATKFAYTTELPSEVPADPIAHFLFDRRRGHCEYFASALALLLRSQGIPSRIVTGYQGGVFNPLTQWYLIRASDAHSWVEAYIPGYGWRTYDPTPAGPALASAPWLDRLSLYADAAEVFWQEWIVGYDQERQIALAGRVGRSRYWQGLRWEEWERWGVQRWRAVDWKTAGIFLTGLIGLLGLAWRLPGLLTHWRNRQHKQRALSGHAQPSDATLLYLHMSELLKRQGVERPAWMTPSEFAATQAVRTRPLVASITDAYNDLRFGNQPESAGRLAQLLTEFEASLRRN